MASDAQHFRYLIIATEGGLFMAVSEDISEKVANVLFEYLLRSANYVTDTAPVAVGAIGKAGSKAFDSTVEFARKLLQKTEKPKVYYMVGFGEQDFTAGGNTFISEMIGLVGGQNIAQNIQGWSISREEILADEPDMIIMPSDLTTLETLQQTEFYKDLDAVKSGHVYEIDGDMISRQGPRIADALVEMAKIINPELNN